MKLWQKALILAVVTESITIAWFVIARRSLGDLPPALLLLHTPAIILIWIEVPWLPAILVEAAFWMLVWYLVLRLFAAPKDELTRIPFIVIQSERKSDE